MNFYKHHLGDYDGHTSHLSWDEDMAYTRLLRAYYRRELPIPAAEAYRLARAASKAQRTAVDSVLNEFFERKEDGWHNKRADEEITTYLAQAETNRRIARERTEQRTVHASSTKRLPNHKPDTRTKNQEPERSKAKSNPLSGGAPDAPPPEGSKSNGKSHGNGAFREEAEAVLAYLNHATGRDFRFRNPAGEVTPNGEVIIARLKEGYTGVQLREVVLLKAEKWRGDEKMDEFLRPSTLFGKQKFSQYVAELGSTT